MNRNVESHFAELPQADIRRSRFDRSFGHKTSFNVGELIPFYVEEVLPGDTFDVTTSAVVRLQTLKTPIMDNIYMDTYYFFVKNIDIWNHWKEFMGENSDSAWIPETTYSVPYTVPPQPTEEGEAYGWHVGTIADYMGIPTDVVPYNQNLNGANFPMSLPFRAYALIVDQWFRDQNLQDPIMISRGDAATQGNNGTDYVTDLECGGRPFIAAKYHDVFTSSLPSPQKSNSISIFPQSDIPGVMGTGNTLAPVIADVAHDTNGVPVAFTNGSNRYDMAITPVVDTGGSTRQVFRSITPGGEGHYYPDNLWADLTAANVTINELRLAFQIQKYYERAARSGTRYRETIRAHFGVTAPELTIGVPEYLGGHRFPLSIHQVANTSQGENDFLGDLGAMSNTADVHSDFVKSFSQHGFIIGMCCVRYDHSYPQGLNKMWSRRNMLDYYWPVFANIGEQPVKAREIFWDNADENDVFGYQEAWYEYRYKPNRVSGEMRPDAPMSLSSWHLADDYESRPYLSEEWIMEDKTNVDRVLQVTSEVSNQVFADFYVKNFATRPMPVFSVPGLIDHN